MDFVHLLNISIFPLILQKLTSTGALEASYKMNVFWMIPIIE